MEPAWLEQEGLLLRRKAAREVPGARWQPRTGFLLLLPSAVLVAKTQHDSESRMEGQSLTPRQHPASYTAVLGVVASEGKFGSRLA